MRCVAVLLVGLAGCTVVGTGLGALSGLSHNMDVDRDNQQARLQTRADASASERTELQRQCDAQREAQSAQIARATTQYERNRLIASMRTCEDDALSPPVKPHISVAGRAFLGFLVGLAIDVTLVLAINYSCEHSPNPGECL